jgi:hypothetical protein
VENNGAHVPLLLKAFLILQVFVLISFTVVFQQTFSKLLLQKVNVEAFAQNLVLFSPDSKIVPPAIFGPT